MKEIVKVLLQEGIDEGTIHEVLDIISEVNPSDETIGKIFQRKANKINHNTGERSYHMQLKNNTYNKGQWHDNHPGASTQDRYDYAAKHQSEVMKLDNESDKLLSGAKRIDKWARKHNNGMYSQKTRDAYVNMAKAGSKNLQNRFEQN